MMEGLSSLKLATPNLQPAAARPAERARQGTPPSEERVVSAGGAAEAKPIDTGRVQALAQQINDTLSRGQGQFSVSVDDATGMVVVRITDAQSGEVVKQIPPQQILDANISVEKIIGLLVNDEA